ncbi:hypothetical protein ACEQ8H_001505 [Pleosporales sp. CAS-2024a]
MNDPDVILYLVPHKGDGFRGAAKATRMNQNKSRLLPARNSYASELPDNPRRQERGNTELPEERGLPENTDCIVLRWSHRARTRLGIVGGRAENVDLSFPDIPGVSAFHLAFTFDDQNRPIARDLGSRGGTKVTYKSEPGHRRSSFDWPLLGPSITRGEAPILNITDGMQFKVIVPPHDIKSLNHIERVKEFLKGTADHEELFPSLSIRTTQNTRRPTGQQTPTKDSNSLPLLYREKIGSGSFGTVKYVWNGREDYVMKKPRKKSLKRNEYDKNAWRREIEIMRSISHDHIVKFRDANFSPHPQLELEYVPGGSLETHSEISLLESTHILRQLSSGLEYLHNRNPSIAHRDIKPENILVAQRDRNSIHVKFADFGLSRAADILNTFCGTLIWAAPEIYRKAADESGTADDSYGVEVDIYSLGVVIAWLECKKLPEYKDGWQKHRTAWIHAVQAHVTKHAKMKANKLLDFVLENMLVEDPNERCSADHCYDEACRLLDDITNPHSQESDDKDSDDGSTTPKPSALAVQSNHTEFPALSSLDTEEPYHPGGLTRTWYSSSVAGSAKRQRIENSSVKYGDHLKCTGSERHSGSRLDGARPSFISEWDGSHLRPFNQSECLDPLTVHHPIDPENLTETAAMQANTEPVSESTLSLSTQ